MLTPGFFRGRGRSVWGASITIPKAATGPVVRQDIRCRPARERILPVDENGPPRGRRRQSRDPSRGAEEPGAIGASATRCTVVTNVSASPPFGGATGAPFAEVEGVLEIVLVAVGVGLILWGIFHPPAAGPIKAITVLVGFLFGLWRLFRDYL